jgi:hypothetical protein
MINILMRSRLNPCTAKKILQLQIPVPDRGIGPYHCIPRKVETINSPSRLCSPAVCSRKMGFQIGEKRIGCWGLGARIIPPAAPAVIEIIAQRLHLHGHCLQTRGAGSEGRNGDGAARRRRGCGRPGGAVARGLAGVVDDGEVGFRGGVV